MTKYITELEVSLNVHQEKNFLAHKFKKFPVDLNKGAGGKEIYLWYKEGSESPITRIQLTFRSDMEQGLYRAGYTKIDKDLNAGAGGNKIYLWYYRGDTDSDVPITKMDVSVGDDAKKFQSDWERLACDLNREAGGNLIFLWLKKEKTTYIADIIATDSSQKDEENFRAGYTRLDESTNRGTGEEHVFLWYLLTTKKEEALKELKLTTNSIEFDNMKQQPGYEYVNMDLNKGNPSIDAFLWYKRDDPNLSPIKGITLIYDKSFIDKYEEAGVTVIDRSLNSGAAGGHCAECCHACDMYLCYYNAP